MDQMKAEVYSLTTLWLVYFNCLFAAVQNENKK